MKLTNKDMERMAEIEIVCAFISVFVALLLALVTAVFLENIMHLGDINHYAHIVFAIGFAIVDVVFFVIYWLLINKLCLFLSEEYRALNMKKYL